MKNHVKLLLLLGSLIAMVSCQNSDILTISGSITGAKGDTLTIKHLVNNVLTQVDSKALNETGKFKFSLEKKEYPEYYFLQVDSGSQLVIIRDSSDVIKIKAKGDMLKEATIEGSNVSVRIQEMTGKVAKLRADYNQLMSEIDDLNADVQKQKSDEFIAFYNTTKDEIGAEIIKEPKSYFSYYALYQRLDTNQLLFSPYDEKDYKYYAMVATSYDLYYKNDPRTVALYKMVEGVIADRRKSKLQQIVKDAPSGLPDIIMNDAEGKERKLSDLNGKVIILNFWASKSPQSRDLNPELLALYNKYKNKGLAVYQVSADKSKILWEAAIEKDHLPWINVCDFEEGTSRAFMMYNVKQLPTTYLIGKDGQMIGRFTSPQKLETYVKEAL